MEVFVMAGNRYMHSLDPSKLKFKNRMQHKVSDFPNGSITYDGSVTILQNATQSFAMLLNICLL